MPDESRTPTSNYLLLDLHKKVDVMVKDIGTSREQQAAFAERQLSMRHQLDELRSWRSGLWKTAMVTMAVAVAVGQFGVTVFSKIIGW